MDDGSTTPIATILKNEWFVLVLWIAVSFSAVLPGVLFRSSLSSYDYPRPSWAPPNWLFGPVWTFLYFSMGVAAWRVWKKGGWNAQRTALSIFLLQLAINALWTPLFFGLKSPGSSLICIVILLAMIVITTIVFYRIDKWAGLLFVPYVLWVSFATVLNAAIWNASRRS